MKSNICLGVAIIYRRTDASYENPSEYRTMLGFYETGLIDLATAYTRPEAIVNTATDAVIKQLNELIFNFHGHFPTIVINSSMVFSILNCDTITTMFEEANQMSIDEQEKAEVCIAPVGALFADIASAEIMKKELPATNAMWNAFITQMKEAADHDKMFVDPDALIATESNELPITKQFSVKLKNIMDLNATYRCVVGEF